MGIDIYAAIEVKQDDDTWQVVDTPEIWRNYEVFSALASGTGSSFTPDIESISDPRGFPDDSPFAEESQKPDEYGDPYCGHDASWASYREIADYDTEQMIIDGHLIIERDEDTGRVLSTAGMTTGKHFGPVGLRRVFDWAGNMDEENGWTRLLDAVGAAHPPGTPLDDTRLVFYFS